MPLRVDSPNLTADWRHQLRKQRACPTRCDARRRVCQRVRGNSPQRPRRSPYCRDTSRLAAGGAPPLRACSRAPDHRGSVRRARSLLGALQQGLDRREPVAAVATGSNVWQASRTRLRVDPRRRHTEEVGDLRRDQQRCVVASMLGRRHVSGRRARARGPAARRRPRGAGCRIDVSGEPSRSCPRSTEQRWSGAARPAPISVSRGLRCPTTRPHHGTSSDGGCGWSAP